MEIKKTDIIRLKKDFSLSSDFKITRVGKELQLSVQILKILEVFHEWNNIDDGMKMLSSLCKKKEDFLLASSEFYLLIGLDFFEIKGEKGIFSFHHSKFDSFPVHVRMLNDEVRTKSFQKAIRELVTKDDIVLDIGTGNGILAATAALAGAKHVYAIEQSDFSEIADAVFKQNGIEGKITLIKNNSLKAQLPVKATILISEIIGTDAFDEGILNTFQDAKNRLLAPGAKIIPCDIKVFAQLIEVPSIKYNHWQLSDENIAQWKADYNVDFSCLREYATADPVQFKFSHTEINKCKLLSAPFELANINFYEDYFKLNETKGSFKVENDGKANAILTYFETQLSTNNCLSLAPGKISPLNSWACPVHLLSSGKNVKAGDLVGFSHRFNNLKSSFKIENQ